MYPMVSRTVALFNTQISIGTSRSRAVCAVGKREGERERVQAEQEAAH
jgi:hypothetical protein